MPTCAYCQGDLTESADVCGGCGRKVAEPPDESGFLSFPEDGGSGTDAAPTTVATATSPLLQPSVTTGVCPACREVLFASDDACGGCRRPVDPPVADSGIHTHVDPPSGVGATVVSLRKDADCDAPPAGGSAVLTDAEPPAGAVPTVISRHEDAEADAAPPPSEDSGILSTGVAPPGASPTVVALEEVEPAATCPVCQGALAETDRVCGRCGRAVSNSFDDATVVSSDANALQTLASIPMAVPKAWLVVTRGCHPRVEYPLRPGPNLIGRSTDDIQIDLADQESPDVALASRRHALIRVESDAVTVEDLASLNGTYLNRTKLKPGIATPLSFGDVVQIGTVVMELES